MRKRLQNKGLFKRQRSTYVQNGMDVNRQIVGDTKGAYFAGSTGDFGTLLTGSLQNRGYQVSFRNMDTGQVFQYRISDRMYIGRCEVPGAQTLVLKEDMKISKQHCMIYEYQGYLCLADLQSKNHTYLNGQRLLEAAYLNDGDVIRAGTTSLKIEFDNLSES